uniref:Uncharacterized protein n=1 Tax=Ditylenchus dipsaci TaxID=166011 RepID=A0A915DTB0_9BILA
MVWRGCLEEGELAIQIKKNVRVFCWIMTAKKNTFSKAIHINSTWAQRCNKHVFITASENSNIPSVDVGIAEGRSLLWGRLKGLSSISTTMSWKISTGSLKQTMTLM